MVSRRSVARPGASGNSDRASAAVTMIALVIVSASCGRTACRSAAAASSHDGRARPGSVRCNAVGTGTAVRPKTCPAPTATKSAMSVAGQRGISIKAQTRARTPSPSQGICSISLKPSSARVTPRPSCSPATTDCGMAFDRRSISPVKASVSKTMPRITPVAATAPGARCDVMTMADTAFIGCTGIGRR